MSPRRAAPAATRANANAHAHANANANANANAHANANANANANADQAANVRTGPKADRHQVTLLPAQPAGHNTMELLTCVQTRQSTPSADVFLPAQQQ